jgi:hypothetical protein
MVKLINRKHIEVSTRKEFNELVRQYMIPDCKKDGTMSWFKAWEREWFTSFTFFFTNEVYVELI